MPYIKIERKGLREEIKMYILLFITLLLGGFFCFGAWKVRKETPLHALFLGILGSGTLIVSGYCLLFLVAFYFG